MPKRSRKKKRAVSVGVGTDKNDRFLMQTASTYVYRHLKAYPNSALDEEFFDLICFGLNLNLNKIIQRALDRFERPRREALEEIISHCVNCQSYFNDIMPGVLERTPKAFYREVHRTVLQALKERIESLGKPGLSEFERNLAGIKKLFRLTDQETEFCLFLYLISANSKLENYFVDHLKCQKLTGRKFLANALSMTRSQLDQVLTGTLRKIGLFEMDPISLQIDEAFLFLFEDPITGNTTERFFKRIPRTAIPLDYHLTVQSEIGQVLNLLKDKPLTSTHILLYGPAGTGKSSFAQGLAKELAVPAYGIAKDDENSSKNRRAGILTCLNMTNAGDGALIVVDEADNILNTRFSWFFRGETQDKGWLNQLMEEPGVRMIWMTNSTDLIEPSVLRRFAFSLHFKPFNKRQRAFLWENILRENKAGKFFRRKEIMALAAKFRVSAGAIDLAVKKALEANHSSKVEFQEGVQAALEAHRTLLNFGEKERAKDKVEENYSLDGLNVKGKLGAMIEQLEKFDRYLRETDDAKVANMNLLFHGPSGTGKSELARYIGERLDREIVWKGLSDLLGPYVGETEQNIKGAFEEAEREEAILIIDEADSLLFSRDRAHHSWEISFTNEFLTRMERFRGILICTTNRVKDLDGASVRRFQQKVRFDYLTPEGNNVFYEKFLAELTDDGPLDKESKTSLEAITGLAPGDFKTVRERFRFDLGGGLTHRVLVEALKAEAEVKRQFNGDQPIGF